MDLGLFKIGGYLDLGRFKIGGYLDLGLFKIKGAKYLEPNILPWSKAWLK